MEDMNNRHDTLREPPVGEVTAYIEDIAGVTELLLAKIKDGTIAVDNAPILRAALNDLDATIGELKEQVRPNELNEQWKFGSSDCYGVIYRFMLKRLSEPFHDYELWAHLKNNGFDMLGLSPTAMMEDFLDWGPDDIRTDAEQEGRQVDFMPVPGADGVYVLAEVNPNPASRKGTGTIGSRAVDDVLEGFISPAQERHDEPDNEATTLTPVETQVLQYVHNMLAHEPVRASEVSQRLLGMGEAESVDEARELLEAFVTKGELFKYRNKGATYYTFDSVLASDMATRDQPQTPVKAEKVKKETPFDIHLGIDVVNAFLGLPQTQAIQRLTVANIQRILEEIKESDVSLDDVRAAAKHLVKLGILESDIHTRGGKHETRHFNIKPSTMRKLRAAPDVAEYLRGIIETE